MPMHARDGGVWKKVNGLHVRDAGVWKESNKGFVRDAGTWKEFHGRYFTDFSEYTLNEQPSDWTKRWDTDSFSALVKNDGTDNYLEFVSLSGNADSALSWDALPTTGGCEALILLERKTVNSECRFMYHGSGTGSAPQGYVSGVRSSFNNVSRRILRLNGNGTFTDLGASANYTHPINELWWLRVNINTTDNTHKVKSWKHGTTEPTSWGVEGTDSTYSTGWKGVFHYPGGTIRIYGFSLDEDPEQTIPVY